MGRTSLVAHMVKHLPTMRKTQVRSLGQEDPLALTLLVGMQASTATMENSVEIP